VDRRSLDSRAGEEVLALMVVVARSHPVVAEEEEHQEAAADPILEAAEGEDPT